MLLRMLLEIVVRFLTARVTVKVPSGGMLDLNASIPQVAAAARDRDQPARGVPAARPAGPRALPQLEADDAPAGQLRGSRLLGGTFVFALTGWTRGRLAR